MKTVIRKVPKPSFIQTALWLALVLLPSLAAQAGSFTAKLQGLDAGGSVWRSTGLQGWKELDLIPARVRLTGGPATNVVIVVQFDHTKGATPGIQNLLNFTNTPNVRITSGPTLSAPPGDDIWSYSFTITLTDANEGAVEFRTRLAAGAHLFGGSSLALSGTPALGTLQIHKPGAAAGSPDLTVLKTGPSNAAPGSTINYTLSYSNKSTALGSGTGVQVSDVLPTSVSFLSSSLTNFDLVGNTITWDLPDLAPGSSGIFTYRVTVRSNVAYGQSFTNWARIFSAENDANPNDNATSVRTTVVFNRAPVANSDAYSVDEDNVLTVPSPGVLANDTDADGHSLSAVLVSTPANGILVFHTNGSFVYTPAPNYNGPDSFTYRASDGQLESAVATVSLTVRPVNDPPVAADDSYAMAEDTLLVIFAPGVLANDTDVDGDVLRALLVSGPTNGVLTLSSNGGFSYRPNTNFHGIDRFTYRASDGQLESSVATVTITVNPVNDAPVAVNDSYSVDEDTTLNVSAPGVLGNDSDVDGDSLTANLVSGPTKGTLTLNADGSFTYRPNTNYHGPDSFTYRASDGQLESGLATVSLTVRPVNDPPLAADDSYAVAEDTLLVIFAPGVLANDTDVDGDVLRALLVSGPTNGVLTLSSNGGFSYRPNTNFHGIDRFTYRASDGQADSAVAVVTLTVTPENDPPVAVNDSYSVDEDTTLNVSAPGVLGNDSDVDGDSLTANLVSGPTKGTLTLNADGSFTYRPNTNYHGPDSFTYRASDGQLESAVATVSLTVRPVNDPPVAANDSYSVDEDTVLNVSAPGVLGNDSDVDGDSLTAHLVSGPTQGTLTLNADGSFTYRPNTNYHGPDSFTYRANDGSAASGIATVTIMVNPINDAPVARDDSYAVPEDTMLMVFAPGILVNDSDVDGDVLTAVLVSGTTNGVLTFSADGSFIYRPNSNFNGIDRFTYRASDGLLQSSVATVTITVNPVNDAPVAVNDSYSVNEDTTLNVSAPGVLGNDSDVDGDSLTASLISGPVNGTLTLNANGSFSYTPTPDYYGPDAFTYQASDGSALSEAATVAITVRPVNDPPSFTKGPNQLVNQNAGAQTVPTWATNIKPGPLNEAGQTVHFVVSNNNPAMFSAQPAISANGTLTYTPAAGASGLATVSVYLRDDGGTENGGVDASPVQTFTIMVNSPPIVSILRPTNGTTFVVSQIISIIADARDEDGIVTNVQFFAGSNLLAETSGPYYTMCRAELPGNYQLRARASDDQGLSALSGIVSITVLQRPPIAAGPIELNRQTGLFEQTVLITNPTPQAFDRVRVLIEDLAPWVTVYNASGQTNGIPFVQRNQPIQPGATATIVIQYYTQDRREVPPPRLVPQLLAPDVTPAAGATGQTITRFQRLSGGAFQIEFNTATNRYYSVQYTHNLTDWFTVSPLVVGTGGSVQWVDNGPPQTQSHPANQPYRFYRVIALP